MANPATFEEDVNFLKKHYPVDVLQNEDGAKVACVAALQGRTMTSTATGDSGQSYGYINYGAFEKGLTDPQINLVGGEDRIWISPEGGQFSVFFDPGVEMSFANWRTPPCIDSETYEVVERTDQSVTYQMSTALTNTSGFTFELELQRIISLQTKADLEKSLSISLGDDIEFVSHQSSNKITNVSQTPWVAETGLIGIWTICMSPTSDNAVMIVPFLPGDEAKLGKIVTADYFGKLEDDRLTVSEELNLIFLRGDGDFRSKLGISFARARTPIGSWNPATETLTIVDYDLPSEAPDGYTNNLWEVQDEPFAGDVVNAYNDGPNDSGTQFGKFYELETVGPALALAPGESGSHAARTTRLSGSRKALDKIALAVFGASLSQIESGLKPL